MDAGALWHAGDAVLHLPPAVALQPGAAPAAVSLVRRWPALPLVSHLQCDGIHFEEVKWILQL